MTKLCIIKICTFIYMLLTELVWLNILSWIVYLVKRLVFIRQCLQHIPGRYIPTYVQHVKKLFVRPLFYTIGSMRIYGRSSREIDLYLQISSQILFTASYSTRFTRSNNLWGVAAFFADVCARQYAEYVIISNQTNVE